MTRLAGYLSACLDPLRRAANACMSCCPYPLAVDGGGKGAEFTTGNAYEIQNTIIKYH